MYVNAEVTVPGGDGRRGESEREKANESSDQRCSSVRLQNIMNWRMACEQSSKRLQSKRAPGQTQVVVAF